MTEAIGDNLVDEIVRRVVGELGRQGAEPAKPQASAPEAPRSSVEPAPPAAGASGARVWITAGLLAGRAGEGKSVRLEMNEYLTPAAVDYARSCGIEVVRGGPAPQAQHVAPPVPGRVRPAVLTRTLGLLVNRPDAKVEAALAALTRGGVATVGFADSECWMVNTRAMCQAICAGQVAGGVIVDRYAAAAMVLAGKVKGVRAVQGVSVAAVTAALRQFDANVLVVGHTTVSVYEMRSMIDRFAAGRRMGRDRTLLMDAIDRVEAEP